MKNTHAQNVYENCAVITNAEALSDFVGNVELGLLNDMQEEVKEMRNHVLYTYYILNRISGLQEITMWASAHHEKLNGKGYPFHLSGEQLFYPARMVACVDIYQALREPRAYKAEKSHESAVQIMKEMAQAGEIDPMIVDDLEKLFRR